MINLRLGNSYSNVTGLTEAQHKELSKLLSYQITQQAAFFGGGYKSTTRYLLSKRGDFASGLLYIVQNYLKTIGNQVNVIDTRKVPERKEGMFKRIMDGI